MGVPGYIYCYPYFIACGFQGVIYFCNDLMSPVLLLLGCLMER